jgi:16S rRNA (guanine966-N2)-methyltransferase
MRIEAGRFKGRQLPRARAARPIPGRLRRSLFGVLAPRLEGARVLDLFAGVGGMGLEALSRGAAEVVLVDHDGAAVAALQQFLETVGAADEGRALRRDALGGALPAGPFDLVFLDPPFALWEGPQGHDLLARAVAVLAPDGLLALKIPARQVLPADGRWQEQRRREVGSVAWALVAAARAGRGS